MFEPTLFGVSTTQLWEIFKLLFLPTMGFAFLFLLGLPLKKIPALADLEGYTPPRWLLPTFSCSSAFAIARGKHEFCTYVGKSSRYFVDCEIGVAKLGVV